MCFLEVFLSQIVIIAFTPWITRLYTPTQYGIFGFFLSIALVAGVLSNFRYAQAIQVTKETEDAEYLLIFCQLSALFFSVIVLLFLAGIYEHLTDLLSIINLDFYIFLLPVTIFLSGLTEANSVWLNRNRDFKSLATSRIITSLVAILGSLLWAYYIDGSFRGLLVSYVLAQSIGVVFLYLKSHKFKKLDKYFTIPKIKSLLKTHKKFPIYSLPADLILVFTNQLPVFMLSRFAGHSEVGYFNMSNRILGLPTIFVSNSVGEVFKQRATEDYHKTGSCRSIFIKTFVSLLLIGIIPFTLIFLFGPQLFAFVLGSQWEIAGEYSRIFSIMFFLRFVNTPLSYVTYITNKQQYHTVGVIVYSVLTAFIFFFGLVWFDIKTVLILFTIGFSLVYLGMFFVNLKLSNQKPTYNEIIRN